MKIVETGTIAKAQTGTSRACFSSGTVTALHCGELLATCRVGADKDGDDEQIEFIRSLDNGHSWAGPERPFPHTEVGGKFGTLKLCYLTELAPDRLIAGAMWVDRTSQPGKPLFNAKTEGCLPMAILLADSFDAGRTWSGWRQVPMPDNIGPPSLTNPILKFADGSLGMSIETNKTYEDSGQWQQRAVLLRSVDDGLTWSEPTPLAQDKSGRIFNWDLRAGVDIAGTVATFAWTYATETEKYQNIHRRISTNHGHSWSQPSDLGFPDQAGPPAMLHDGRVVLAWVDRFEDQCIRARIAPSIDGNFDPDSEVVVYAHPLPKGSTSQDTGELLVGMEMWSFGLPFATALPGGDVLVTYYAGDAHSKSLHFARIAV